MFPWDGIGILGNVLLLGWMCMTCFDYWFGDTRPMLTELWAKHRLGEDTYFRNAKRAKAREANKIIHLPDLTAQHVLIEPLFSPAIDGEILPPIPEAMIDTRPPWEDDDHPIVVIKGANGRNAHPFQVG
jgi:hypothetical protein